VPLTLVMSPAQPAHAGPESPALEATPMLLVGAALGGLGLL